MRLGIAIAFEGLLRSGLGSYSSFRYLWAVRSHLYEPPSLAKGRTVNFDWTRRPLRLLFGTAYQLLKLVWFVRRPRSYGAHALALTRPGKVVLVKLRYAPGWRLPGGGRGPSEEPREAVLRELSEEIGMTAHGSVELACEIEEEADHKRDLASLFIVRDVEYRPNWSWEVEQVIEADLDSLPSGLSPRAAGWLVAIRPKL